MGLPSAACDDLTVLPFAAFFSLLSFSWFILSRLLMPYVIPKTYAKLGREPGAQGYWDASFASTANSFVTAGLAIHAFMRSPSLMTSEDLYLKTPETCVSATAFVTWVCFELCCQLYYLRQWREGPAILIHHVSAIAAWALYLQGGYGHALSLVGSICELTNPFMNMRYFLATLELRASRLYVLNGVAFVLAWLAVRVCYALAHGCLLIYRQQAMWTQLPPWRAAAFVGFYCVGAALNSFWFVKLVKGAYMVIYGGKRKKTA